MGKTILKNVTLLYGARDISGVTNSLDPGQMVDEKETTNFASNGYREYLGSMRAATWQYSGFWESLAVTGEPDSTFHGKLGMIGVPATATFTYPCADGDIAWFMNALSANYKAEAKVGEVAAYSLKLMSAGPYIRGRVLDSRTATATGNGAALELGAVTSSQRLFYAVHVLAASGTTPTLDLVIQSDNGSGFASPATGATLAQITGTAYVIGYVDGPITDDYFRVARTLGGTTPSFQYVAVIGIGPKP